MKTVSRRYILAIFLSAALVNSCAHNLIKNQSSFNISYEISGTNIEAGILYFFDEKYNLSLIGKRELESNYTGEPINTEICRAEIYCIISRNYPVPIVISSKNIFEYSSYKYNRLSAGGNFSDCDVYTVIKNEATVVEYVYCTNIGIISFDFYFDGEIRESMRLKSYIGLASDI